MRLPNSSLRRVTLSLFFMLILPFARAAPQTTNIPARITMAVDEKSLVVLKGNVHPLARPEFDQGAVSDAQPLNRMLLLLQRSPDQESTLRQLLDDQQTKSSPSYHAWLTPEQFGKQFGPADADIQAVTQWLSSQGFTGISIGPGRQVIEFSGTSGQVRNAFRTEIRRFVVDGKEHTANAVDPQIPAALTPVVAGVVSLHNFPRKSYARILGQFRRTIGKAGLQPLFTFPNPFNGQTFYGLCPGDFATIYNTKPLITGSPAIDGTGQTIAIVGETNFNVQDVQQFRKMFGLPANFDATNVVLNGEDPGITSRGEEGEADLDVEWSGAVAPGAAIKFVLSASTPASAGVDLSALYIVEHNFAGVMSESYGDCEKDLGSAGNAFYNSLWEQAAAQGITVVLSSGDGGSAGCDDFNKPQPATQGLAVSGLASTPFNVSVGGTDFDEVNNWAAYWNSTNDATGTSAKSYIPEIPWSENCAQIGLTGCGASAPQGSVNIVAGSGGPSGVYGKPNWQMGVAGMPNDNHRDQPDISLFASPGFDGTGYVYCQSDQTISGAATCDLNASTGVLDFGIVGGTSASAPAFAGIMALVNQKQATLANPAPRQGNANYVLYALAKKSGSSCRSNAAEASGCIFNDITKGNSALPTGLPGVGTNSVPCLGGSPNCGVSTAGSNGVLVDPNNMSTEAWTAIAGYDMTTGLGTINANNLATNWGSVSTIPTTTTLTLSPTTGITHGTGENVTVGVTVKPNTGTGVPAGDVSLIATFADGSTQGFGHFTLVSGAVSGVNTQSLPGGTYTVIAHYAGDGSNAPSDSTPVQVAVAPENSKTFASLVIYDINGNLTNFGAASGTYGAGFNYFRVDVGGGESTVSPTTGISSNCAKSVTNCPTGTVTLTSTGASLGVGSLALNNAGYAFIPPLYPGNYSVTATYPGDTSYSPSSGSANFVIAKAPTTITAGYAGTPVQYGNSEEIACGVGTNSLGVAPTGTFQFLVDGSPVGAPVPVYESGPYSPHSSPPSYAWADAISSTEFLSVGDHTLAATYSGDANYLGGTSAPVTVTVSKALPNIATWGASPATINLGQQTMLTVTMYGSSAGVPPTGTMTFYDGTAALSGTVTYTPLTRGLSATLPYTATTAGTHQINVSYSGDSNYLPTSNPVPATLTVVGPDFSIASSGTTAQTVKAGQTATFTNAISITAQNGFSSQVNLSCSLPVAASATTCTVAPNMLASGSGTATVTVTTMARGFVPPVWPQVRFIFRPQYLPGVLLTLLLSALLLRLARTRRQRFAGALPLAGLFLFLTLQAIGCGGGGGSSGPPPPTGTPTGTYAVTVTSTASTNNGNLTHTTTLTLVVQ
jgi:Pro-kumamolisin, activation domain/Bacterial Ig-like domain (group 3)